MSQSELSAKLWWSVPASAVVLLLLLITLTGGPKEEKRSSGTSYDAAPGGFRAAYLLLEELRYPVTRSKRPTGDTVRWVLFPTSTKDAPVLDEWVRQGGSLVLAVRDDAFAKEMGFPVQISEDAKGDEQEPTADPEIENVMAGVKRVESSESGGSVQLEAGGKPFVTVYPRGRGKIWLLHRPDFLTNRYLGQADNAVLLCRLAEESLAQRSGKAAFDEYFHGMRERPGILELLLEPPALWVTLQSCLFLGILLWHYMPRFGTLHPPATFRRRSKEEFLDAMASILERKGDVGDAFRATRDGLVREIEQELGLPVNCPPAELIRHASRGRSFPADRLAQLLQPDAVPRRTGKLTFLQATNDLETIRKEFFHGRHDR
jgi:hypothetical protein